MWGDIDDILTLLTFPFLLLAFVFPKTVACLLWLSFAIHFGFVMVGNWSNTPHVHFGSAVLVMMLAPSFIVALLTQIAYVLKRLVHHG